MNGAQIYYHAKLYLGIQCVHEGYSPNKGFNSAGFVYYVHNDAGFDCPRYFAEIISGGYPGTGAVGDVIYWKNQVGICDGTGNVIQAYKKSVGIYNIEEVNNELGKYIGFRRYYH